MFRINIVDLARFEENYINILTVRESVSEYRADVCLGLQELSFPIKSVLEMRFAGAFLEKMHLAVASAWLMSCKTWLAIQGASFLNINVSSDKQRTKIVKLLQVCGYHVKESANGQQIIAVDTLTPVYLSQFWQKIIVVNFPGEVEQTFNSWKNMYQLFYQRWRAKEIARLPLSLEAPIAEIQLQEQQERKFVGVYLWGGLGNQLYLYAFAKSLAERWQAEVKLDTSWFSLEIPGVTPREYKLKHFSITANHIKSEDYAEFLRKDVSSGPWQDNYDYKARCILQEQFSRSFDPGVFGCEPSLLVTGYWQSYKYFAHIKNILLKEFTITTPPSEATAVLCQKIAECNSVSIHIRRGDYLIPGQGHVLPATYYVRALQMITSKVITPHFYIFSDDPEWVRKNVVLNYPMTVVDVNTEKSDYDDLRMMSLCKHHILANSTFSWWAAWLNPSDEKIVVAPSYGRQDDDIYPQNWHVIL